MNKINFDFEEHKNKNEVVRCKTQEEADLWCEFMDENGLKWHSGASYLGYNYWNKYKEDTCYFFNRGYHVNIEYAIKNGYTVIEFSDIYVDDNIFTKNMLETGMVVEERSGKKFMFFDAVGAFVNKDDCTATTYYKEDLLSCYNSSHDIMKIYQSNCPSSYRENHWDEMPCIWKRHNNNLWNGMTYEEAHRRMFNWLADNPHKEKVDWLKENNTNNEVFPISFCFACEFTKNMKREIDCEKCPLGKYDNGCGGGSFVKWTCSEGFEKAKLAKQIAELPWIEK